jgi:hypothetical protein
MWCMLPPRRASQRITLSCVCGACCHKGGPHSSHVYSADHCMAVSLACLQALSISFSEDEAADCTSLRPSQACSGQASSAAPEVTGILRYALVPSVPSHAACTHCATDIAWSGSCTARRHPDRMLWHIRLHAPGTGRQASLCKTCICLAFAWLLTWLQPHVTAHVCISPWAGHCHWPHRATPAVCRGCSRQRQATLSNVHVASKAVL